MRSTSARAIGGQTEIAVATEATGDTRIMFNVLHPEHRRPSTESRFPCSRRREVGTLAPNPVPEECTTLKTAISSCTATSRTPTRSSRRPVFRRRGRRSGVHRVGRGDFDQGRMEGDRESVRDDVGGLSGHPSCDGQRSGRTSSGPRAVGRSRRHWRLRAYIDAIAQGPNRLDVRFCRRQSRFRGPSRREGAGRQSSIRASPLVPAMRAGQQDAQIKVERPCIPAPVALG
jgi:hypothetical protein